MLDVRIDSIIYQSQIYYRNLVNTLVRDKSQGKTLDSKWRKADTILGYLEALNYRTYLTEQADIDNVNYILYCLIKLCGLYRFPVSAPIEFQEPPDVLFGLKGDPGDSVTGPRGETGLATDFDRSLISVPSVVDSFPVGDAEGARWDYIAYDNGSTRFAGSVIASWKPDGSGIELGDTGTPSSVTDVLTFDVEYLAGNIRLLAIPTSAIWRVRGSRYFIPNNGNGSGPISGALSNGKVYIGNASNIATEQTVSGAITLNNTGVATLSAGIIVDANINASAGIALSKLAALTANRVTITNGSGIIITSSISTTTLSYLDVTSSIQTQLNSKQATITGGASSIVSLDLTASRALVSSTLGKVEVHPTATSTALGYIASLSSDAQAQINSKQATITGAATTVTSSNLTANRLLVSDASGKIAVSAAGSGAGAPGGSNNELQYNNSGVFGGTGIFYGGTGILSLTGNWSFTGTGDAQYTVPNGFGITTDHTGTNNVYDVLTLTRTTPNTPANNIGTGIRFNTETSNGNIEYGSAIQSICTLVTPGSENFDISFLTMDSGVNLYERFRIGGNSITVGGSIVNLGSDVWNSATARNIQAAGTGSNIDINILSKGTGLITFTTPTLSTSANFKTTGGIDAGNNGTYLKTKVIQITNWNMHVGSGGVGTKTIAHGLTVDKIRSINGIVKNDTATAYYPMTYFSSGTTPAFGVGSAIDATNIVLVRATGSNLDAAGFSGTGDRGWIVITYEA